MLNFASDDIKNKSVAWDLLVALDLNDVTCLDATPVRDLKALVSLREDELLHRLTINFLSRLL